MFGREAKWPLLPGDTMGSSSESDDINMAAVITAVIFGVATLLLLVMLVATGAPWGEGGGWTPTTRAGFIRGYLSAGAFLCIGGVLISGAFVFRVRESDKGLIWKLAKLALLGVGAVLLGLLIAMRMTWVLAVPD
jgi:hypothetical protein